MRSLALLVFFGLSGCLFTIADAHDATADNIRLFRPGTVFGDTSVWFVNGLAITAACIHICTFSSVAFLKSRMSIGIDCILITVAWSCIVGSVASGDTVLCVANGSTYAIFGAALAWAGTILSAFLAYSVMTYSSSKRTSMLFASHVTGYAVFAAILTLGKTYPLNVAAAVASGIVPLCEMLTVNRHNFIGWTRKVVPPLAYAGFVTGWVLIAAVCCKTCRVS